MVTSIKMYGLDRANNLEEEIAQFEQKQSKKIDGIEREKQQIEVERDLYFHECKKLRDILMDVKDQFEKYKEEQTSNEVGYLQKELQTQ